MALILDVLAALQRFWPHALLFLLVIRLCRNRYKTALSDIPGPFLASLTDVWLFFHCLFGRSWKDYELHRKYNSPLLRLGPNTVSVSDSEAIRVIYSYKRIFPKSHLYITQSQTSANGDIVPNLASTMDEDLHARLRRPVANAYAMSTLVEFEPLVDSTFDQFVEQMTNRFVNTGDECNLGQWLQMYAFDLIGELTFSKRFGFLETGADVGRMMHFTGQVMDYTGIIGQLPYLDEYFRVKNVFLRKLRGGTKVVNWTMDRIREHTDEGSTHPDFLTRFVQAREKYPDIMTDNQMADFCHTNVAAGSDTTAIALRELVFHILTHPGAYEKIMEELTTALSARSNQAEYQGEQYNKPISWTEGSQMSYYQACIKECLRYHPALGQLVPRTVPEGGVEICGSFLPEGTVVGCNAWTVHRDKQLYGEDADEFRPERWLNPDKAYVQKMENLSFAFGGGTRVCIGRNIAMLEVTKFMPEFLRRFEVKLVDPKRYKSIPGWLVPQIGLDVTLKLRRSESLEIQG